MLNSLFEDIKFIKLSQKRVLYRIGILLLYFIICFVFTQLCRYSLPYCYKDNYYIIPNEDDVLLHRTFYNIKLLKFLRQTLFTNKILCNLIIENKIKHIFDYGLSMNLNNGL